MAIGEPSWKRTLYGHEGPVACLDFSPDGETLASGGHDGTVRLWDINTNHEVRQLEVHAGPVRCIAFSSTGRHIATGDGVRIRVWDPANGEELHRLDSRLDLLTSLAFSPSGEILAAGSQDGTILLWNGADTFELQERVQAAPETNQISRAASLAFSPDGCGLACAGGDIRLWQGSGNTWSEWSAKLFKTSQVDGLTSGAIKLTFSPDGSTLVSSHRCDRLCFWNAVSGKLVQTIDLRNSQNPGSDQFFAFGPYSELLVTGGGEHDRSLRFWDASLGTCALTLAEDHMTCVTWSPYWLSVAAGTESGWINLYLIDGLHQEFFSLTTERIIRRLPLASRLKANLLDHLDHLDSDQKSNIEQTIWNLFFELYKLRRDENQQVMQLFSEKMDDSIAKNNKVTEAQIGAFGILNKTPPFQFAKGRYEASVVVRNAEWNLRGALAMSSTNDSSFPRIDQT